MKRLRFPGYLLSLAASLTIFCAQAEDFPSRPLRIVAPAGPGTVPDAVARIFGQSLAEQLRQPVIVENRAGAGGVLAVREVSKAKPDGYTLMIGSNTTMAANVYLYKSFDVDPLKDFTPLALIVENPFVLLVSANSPFKSVKDLIAAAKAAPGKLTYGSPTGSALLCMELLKSLTGVDVVKVPYKASPQALTDLIGGQIDVSCDPLASSQANRMAGRTRALAQTGASRSALAPDLETAQEAGIAGMEYGAWQGFWAPAGLPKDVAARLSGAILTAMKDPDILQKLRALGSDPRPAGPEGLAAMQRTELSKIGAVVKKAQIAAE